MKTLPPSWVKKQKDEQLSFADSLFNKPTAEDVLVERLLDALRNAKFLRYRIQHSAAKKGEKIATYVYWTDILDAGAAILYKVSKKSMKYKHKTLDDFLHDVVVERIDHAPTESISRRELLQHHDNVTGSITGILLASKPQLRGMTREVKSIFANVEASKNLLHQLL